MFNEIANLVSWTDLLFIAIVVRGYFLGLSNGLIYELIRILITCITVFITLHYFDQSLAFFSNKATWIHPGVFGVAIFVTIWAVVGLAGRFILNTIALTLKDIQTPAGLDKWFSSIAGVGCGLIIGSMAVLLCYHSQWAYIRHKISNSVISSQAVSIAPRVYYLSYAYVVGKVAPGVSVNDKALKFIDGSALNKEKEEEN